MAVLPINGLTLMQRRRTMKLSTFNGILISLFLILITGPMSIAYAIKLGADQLTVGVLVAMPLLAQVFGLFAPYLAGIVGQRKWLAVLSAVLGYLSWGLAVSVPLFAKESASLGLYIALIGFASLFLAINNALWADWLAQVVPLEECGTYFSVRSALMSVSGTALNLGLGYWLDSIGAPIWALQTVFYIGITLALIGAVVLAMQNEPGTKIMRVNLQESLIMPLKNNKFRRVLAAVFSVYFSLSLITPIVNTYLIEFMKANFTTLALCYGLTSIISLCFAKQWGKLIDLAGSKPMIRLGLFVVGAILPISLIFATPKVSWPIYLAAALESLVSGVVAPALFRLAIKGSPPAHSIVYLSSFTVVIGVGSALGAFLSGPLFNLLAPVNFVLLGVDWNAYRLMFVIGIGLRLRSLSMVSALEERNAWSVRKTIRFVVLSILKRAG